MTDSSAPKSPPPRIPYSPGYLLAVGVLAILNTAFFYLLAGHLENPETQIHAKGILSVFFGLLFAGGSNLTAMALARTFQRRQLADRILLFLFTEVTGLTLLSLALPLLADFFWKG